MCCELTVIDRQGFDLVATEPVCGMRMVESGVGISFPYCLNFPRCFQ